MRIEPASLDQIHRAYDGRMEVISPEAGTVAADLKAIDPGLTVRISRDAECFVVFYGHCVAHGKHDPGCSVCRAACEEVPPQEFRPGVAQDIVLSVNAHRSPRLGILTGLDQRVVERIREINPEGPGGYDFAKAVERANVQARERERKERIARLEVLAEPLAHAARKDLGVRYRGRTFVPREVPNAES